MRKNILIILLIVGIQFIGNSQCVIDDLIAEAHDCENGTFLVDIDFNPINTSDSFTIVGNGNNYGTFAYSDLYLTLGPFDGDGTTEYEFIITDSDNPDCSAFTGIGPINCNNDCELWDLEVEAGDCNSDGTYELWINFLYQNVNNDFFDVFANGEFFGFYEFSNLPLEIENFPMSGNDNDVIKICVNDHPDCCTILEFDSPNCNDDCGITDIIVEAHDCENGMFLVDLDFNYTGNSNTFTVVGNGNNYGTFEYSDLYLTLGPFVGDGSTIYEFIITDSNHPDCTNFGEIGPINCDNDCEIWDLEVEAGDCNSDGTYELWVNFLYQNVNNDFFDVFANGEFFGFYEFSDLPLEIENFPMSGNDNDVIKICVNDHPDCCTILEFDSPDCNDDCEINNFIAEAYDCDDDGMFLVDIDFDAIGSSDSFQLVGNGTHYGVFAYDDLYLTLGPLAGDGITEYEFIAIDMSNPNCTNFIEINPVECVVTNTNNFITKQIQIFPNPTNDFIFIKNESNQSIENIIIVDAIGHQLKSLSNHENQIDVSDLAAGVYFLQIKTEDEWLFKKFVVNKN